MRLPGQKTYQNFTIRKPEWKAGERYVLAIDASNNFQNTPFIIPEASEITRAVPVAEIEKEVPKEVQVKAITQFLFEKLSPLMNLKMMDLKASGLVGILTLAKEKVMWEEMRVGLSTLTKSEYRTKELECAQQITDSIFSLEEPMQRQAIEEEVQEICAKIMTGIFKRVKVVQVFGSDIRKPVEEKAEKMCFEAFGAIGLQKIMKRYCMLSIDSSEHISLEARFFMEALSAKFKAMVFVLYMNEKEKANH